MNRRRSNFDTNNFLELSAPKKVGLIGLGRISFSGNYLSSSETIPLTHYSNLQRFPDYQVRIGVDPDPYARKFFNENTGIECVSTIEEISEQLDFVVIACPTEMHLFSTLKLLDKSPPKHLVIEKPVGNNLDEANEIFNLANARGVKLYIPYHRRYNPEMIRMRNEISAKKYGNIELVTVQYGQGLKSNGCHFLNLVDFLIGGISGQVMDINNLNDENPSWKSYSSCGKTILFIGVNTKIRSGEIRIICENGEFFIGQGGNISYQGLRDPNSGWLNTPILTMNHDSKLNMLHFYDAIIPSIQCKDVYQSDIDSALRTHAIMSQVLKS